jgi:hypothetical protein
LGKNGEVVYNIDSDIQPSLKADFEAAGKRLSIDDFNKIVSKYNLPTWTKIFKGDFSGYVNGLASKNKGNAFEAQFVADFVDYQSDLENVLGLESGELDGAAVTQKGGENNKRPLKNVGGKLTIGDPSKVGETVCDVEVISTSKQTYNLSLKSGSSVSFCNIGIKEFFPDKSFKNLQAGKTDKFETGSKNGVDGMDVLNMLGIDLDRFAQTFINYKNPIKRSKSLKDIVDVKDIIKKNGFMDFLESIVGYGYILVHEIKNQVHMHKIMDANDMKKFIGTLQSADVLYPTDGNAKRIDVLIHTSTLKLNVEIRNKQGGIYPDQILCKYWVK